MSPQRNIDGADRTSVDAVGGEEIAAEHELPKSFVSQGSEPTTTSAEMVDGFHDRASRAGCSDFAEPMDPGIGFDADEEGDAAVVGSDGDVLYFGNLHLFFLSFFGGPPQCGTLCCGSSAFSMFACNAIR